MHQKKKQYKLILNWIESQNSNSNHEKDRRISNIQESLIENSYTITKTRDNRFIAAIEINTSSDGTSQGIKDAKKYLVIRLNDKDSIQWAMLFEFSNKRNTIPDATTFANFFESEEVQDGKYRVTTIWGSFLFESEYLNNTVITHKALEKKENIEQPTFTLQQQCTAWYYVTTYYYSDGSSETHSEYIGTSCTGCAPDMIECPGGGGGSGGGENYSVPVTKTVGWRVYTTGYWYLDSYETLSGIKTDGMGGGHFTGNTHVNEQLINTQIGGYANWHKLTVTTSYQYASASARVIGKVTYTDQTPDVPVDKTKHWFFPDVPW